MSLQDKAGILGYLMLCSGAAAYDWRAGLVVGGALLLGAAVAGMKRG